MIKTFNLEGFRFARISGNLCKTGNIQVNQSKFPKQNVTIV